MNDQEVKRELLRWARTLLEAARDGGASPNGVPQGLAVCMGLNAGLELAALDPELAAALRAGIGPMGSRSLGRTAVDALRDLFTVESLVRSE